MKWTLAWYFVGVVHWSGGQQFDSVEECVEQGYERLYEFKKEHGEPDLVSIVCHQEWALNGGKR